MIPVGGDSPWDRGAPAPRTDDGAVTPEEVASIVASGRAITTVPEIVALPFIAGFAGYLNWIGDVTGA